MTVDQSATINMAEDVLPSRAQLNNSEPVASTSQGAHYETQDGVFS